MEHAQCVFIPIRCPEREGISLGGFHGYLGGIETGRSEVGEGGKCAMPALIEKLS